jgi:hypothetical protein
MLVLMIPGHAGIRPTFFDSFLLKGSLRDKDYPKDVIVVVVLVVCLEYIRGPCYSLPSASSILP